MSPAKATAGLFVTAVSIAFLPYFVYKARSRKTQKRLHLNTPRNGLVASIGNTYLIRINSLSEATGCEVPSERKPLSWEFPIDELCGSCPGCSAKLSRQFYVTAG